MNTSANPAPEPTVRPARPEDLEAIVGLARACGLPESGIAEALAHFVVAERSSSVIGTCGLERHARDGLLRSLGVAAPERNRGVGRLLVAAVLREARRDGVGSVYLLTTTARDFFFSLGFREAERSLAPAAIRESWEFKAGCPSTAVLMQREPPPVTR